MATPRIPNRTQADHLRQYRAVRTAFPGFTGRIGRNQSMTWTGWLQPTSDSPEYRVRVEYHPGRHPRVFVETPALDAGTPHLYRDGGNRFLCLYWPKEWDWYGSDRSIAGSIIPWAAVWLYYYEVWQCTGEWLGPSSHGPEPKSPQTGMTPEVRATTPRKEDNR